MSSPVSSSSLSLPSRRASPTSAPSSPFSNLPVELVGQIIESTVPLHLRSTTYNSRQSTLRSLCLVSRLFRQFAQPLLHSVVSLSVFEMLNRWKDARGPRSKLCMRELACFGFCGRSPVITSLLQQQTRLTTLVLEGMKGPLDLTMIVQLRELRILRLENVELSCPHLVVFPRLQELGLGTVKLRDSSTSPFDDSTFPSLLALAHDSHHFVDTSFSSALVQEIIMGAPGRLEVVSLNIDSAATLPNEVFDRIKHRTLFDCCFENVHERPGLNHLRIVDDDHTNEEVTEAYLKIAATTKDRLPSLLYLPPALDPGKLENREGYNGKLECLALAKVCREKDIEVVFEELPADWWVDSSISTDFWRRMRRKGSGNSRSK